MAFEDIVRFFEWARAEGSVHIKGPYGFEALWLPPEVPVDPKSEPVEDGPYEELTMSQWAKMRPPGIR